MQGQHSYHKSVSLESFVPPHHFLRRVQRILNFSFVRELTAPFYSANKGRPSIDPKILFQMILIGFFYAICSDRHLCEQIHYNLLYRWFCFLPLKDKVLDHSSLTRFRNRLGQDVFQQFFEIILKVCQKEDLLKGDEIMVDSTLIQANASLNSLVLSNNVVPKDKRSNQTHISTTDPDTTLPHKPGSSKGLKYKAHYLADRSSRLILDCWITTGACHDSQTVLERLAYIAFSFDLPIQSVIADRAYGCARILASLVTQNITSYIPLFNRRTRGIPDDTSDFQYDQDRYVCSQGTVLRYTSINADNKLYQVKKKACFACSKVTLCMPHIEKRTADKCLTRNVHQPLFEAVQTKMHTPLFKEKMKKRFWLIEGLIAEARTWHTFARARFRRKHKMQIQAYMTAMVQNIIRLVSYLNPLSNFFQFKYALSSKNFDFFNTPRC